ncbi:MAG: hypothetical protein U0840_09290 [Gemmataceae bacterium]
MSSRLMLCAIVLALPFTVLAEEKVSKKPQGTFVREADGQKITLSFKADAMTVTVGDDHVVVEAAYAVTGDVLFGSITKVKKQGDGGPDKRDLFSFQFAVKDKELIVSELKGTQVNDDSRRLVEGTYKKE